MIKNLQVERDTHDAFKKWCRDHGWIMRVATKLALIEYMNRHTPMSEREGGPDGDR